MPTSSFPSNVTGVTVQTATSGALSGDGSSGNKLAVGVDGVTIDVNGSNQLEVKSGFDLAVNSIVGVSAQDTIVLPTATANNVLGIGPTIFNTGIYGFQTFNGPAGVTIQTDDRVAWALALVEEVGSHQMLFYPGEIAFGVSALNTGLGISTNTLDGMNFAEFTLTVTGPTAGELLPGDGVSPCTMNIGNSTAPWNTGYLNSVVPTATAFTDLPTPDANTFPIAIVNDSTVTSGTVSAGSGMHVNVIVWTGSVWTVFKNLT
jgi:hypothetical protein